MNTQSFRKAGVVMAITLGVTTATVHADDRGERHASHEGWVLDGRYNHNHYYPRPGYVVHGLPRGAISVRYRGSPYFFHEGAWYRSGPYGYAVVRAPIGAFLPILPPFYSTVWFSGVPYYYADDVYYVRDESQNGYVVATPPEGVEADTRTPNSGSDDLFTYPKNNQSTEQQSTDRYECHHWASDQTGFDPTQPLGGVSSSQVDGKRADYRRAQIACLEARGYSVK